ncbi:unnamed protein product, partial [marine sediment metagenome]
AGGKPNSPGTGGGGKGSPGGGAGGNTGTPGKEGIDEGGEGAGALDESNAENESAGTIPPGGGETDDGGNAGAPMRTAASLLRDQTVGEEMRKSPVTLEHLPVLLDCTTAVPPKQRTIPGLININTAPRRVLRCLEDLSPEAIDAILEARERVPSEAKATIAWLLAEEVVDLDTFERIAPQITARGQQFTIEALGYADHVGMVTRLQVVVDAVGPIVQTIYYRDVTYLG